MYEKVDLNMNISKTIFMTNLVTICGLRIAGVEIQMEDVYLGHQLSIPRSPQTCELERRLALPSAAIRGLKDVFKSDISVYLKRRIFDQFLLPVTTYGTETLTLTNDNSCEKLRIAQRKMERSMIVVTLSDHIRNEDLRGRSGVIDVVETIARFERKWVGHIAKMLDER